MSLVLEEVGVDWLWPDDDGTYHLPSPEPLLLFSLTITLLLACWEHSIGDSWK